MAKSTSKYLSTNKKQKIKHRALIHGPAKHGKTFSALLADPAITQKKLDAQEKSKKWIKAKNLLWVPFDDGALHGALERKIEVPSLDVDGMMTEFDIIGVLDKIGEVCHDAAADNSDLIVVVDTVTKMDKLLNAWWNDEENAPKGRGGNVDGYAVYRCIQETHLRFHDDMAALPCHVIFLAHSKPLGESASVKAKAKAGGLPAEGPTDIIMDFNYYASGNIYRQDTSIIATVKHESDGRFAYTETVQGSEGGCRFQAALDVKEPADFGIIFGKIDAQLK